MATPHPPRFHYRLGLNQPAASPTARRLAEMAEAIGRDTDGVFRLDVFPESRLGPDPQMLADMRTGKLEFFVAGATLGELAPSSALPLLPFAFADSAAVTAEVREFNPLNVVLSPAEIATTYTFLASAGAAAMTGEVLRPDGGLSVR